MLWRGKRFDEAWKLKKEHGKHLPPIAKKFLKACFQELVVVDDTTGLMWTRHDNGHDIDWHGAEQHANHLKLAGYADWQLPTIGELEVLYDSVETNIRKPFRLTGLFVWSSTIKFSDTAAWNFNFSGGERFVAFLDSSSNGRALCVRRSPCLLISYRLRGRKPFNLYQPAQSTPSTSRDYPKDLKPRLIDRFFSRPPVASGFAAGHGDKVTANRIKTGIVQLNLQTQTYWAEPTKHSRNRV